ncbi:MAG: SAM-dependent methyltransferase [Flavobacteriales bacterium]|nr:SAM-dependent methyltransferase [Flavobacteriales bacterium]
MNKMSGAIYLLPTWLGEHGGTEQLSPESCAVAERLTLFFCEDERSARRALRRMHPSLDFGAIELHRFDKDSSATEAKRLIELVRNGRDAGIISEAGMPCIADPGALIVAAAHEAGVPVVPLSGPSALLLALAASGLNGQRFAFHGYLPVKPNERAHAIRALESEATRGRAAQLFIETPYRNEAMLADLIRHCSANTMLTIAIDITQPNGWVRTRCIAQWRQEAVVLGKRPAVFIVGAR